MNRLIKHVISLFEAKYSPHICMHTFFPMTCICALWLWDRFRFVFLSVFSSPQTHHLKFLEAIQKCYETPHPLSTSGILAVYFFFYFLAQKQSEKNTNARIASKRDIKVLPILFVNHHDLLILTCCYQKSHLSSKRMMEVRYLGEGGVWVPQLQKYCSIIAENG